MKVEVPHKIGNTEIVEKNSCIEVVRIDLDNILFTIEHDLRLGTYYDKTTKERLKVKRSPYGSYENIFVNKFSFISQLTYKIVITRFDTGEYSVGYVFKSRLIKK